VEISRTALHVISGIFARARPVTAVYMLLRDLPPLLQAET
jgi:hypothetical protein